MKLNKTRQQIDKTDKKIAKLLNKRFLLVDEVKQIKLNENIEVEDSKREETIIALNSVYIDPKFKEQYIKIYQAIFESSKAYQKK